MNKFIQNLNFYRIKYLLKINKLLSKNKLCEKEGYCKFTDIKNKLNCKKLSIQLYKNDNKDELFRILPLLLNSGIEIELIQFDKILENEDIRQLGKLSPNITVNLNYIIDSYYSGSNVETAYNVEDYSKILDKIEYLTKTAKMNFSQVEEQVMFVATQLSEYISFYNEYSELDEEQFKEKSSLKGAFLEKETVCIGFSMAFERCMSALGIESRIILGDANFGKKVRTLPWNGNHAWNEVKIGEKWYNIDVTWLSSYENNVDLKDAGASEMTEDDIIQKYVLSDDASFVDHYKLEDNGIICREGLKERFKIYKNVKRYKNVLNEYDKGKRNNMLQIKLETNNPEENELADREAKGIEEEQDEIIDL